MEFQGGVELSEYSNAVPDCLLELHYAVGSLEEERARGYETMRSVQDSSAFVCGVELIKYVLLQ